MENFAEYILNEKNYLKKIEIAYYLHKNANTFFDKSVICKTELARRFIETMNIDVDENSIDVKLTNKVNNDGTTGAPILYAKDVYSSRTPASPSRSTFLFAISPAQELRHRVPLSTPSSSR